MAKKQGILTSRQLECAQWLAVGKHVDEVAQIMGVTKKSAENFRYQVYQRLRRFNVENRVELTHWMLATGRVELLYTREGR